MGKPLFELAGEVQSALENHPARQNNLPQVRIVPKGEDQRGAVRHFGFITTDEADVLRIEESGHPGKGNFFEARLPNVLLPKELAEVKITDKGAVGLHESAYGYFGVGVLLPVFDLGEPIVPFIPENRWEDLTPADLQILENGLTALLQSLKDQKDEVFITVPLPSPIQK